MLWQLTVGIVGVNANVWQVPAADCTVNTTTVAELTGPAHCQTKNCSGMTTHRVHRLQIYWFVPTQANQWCINTLPVIISIIRSTPCRRSKPFLQAASIVLDLGHVAMLSWVYGGADEGQLLGSIARWRGCPRPGVSNLFGGAGHTAIYHSVGGPHPA